MNDINVAKKSRRPRKPQASLAGSNTSSNIILPETMTIDTSPSIIDRDAEYRKLNAQLREKNYRLQQLQQQLNAGSDKKHTGMEKSDKQEKEKAKRNRGKRTNKDHSSTPVNHTPTVSATSCTTAITTHDAAPRGGMLRVAVPMKSPVPSAAAAPAPVFDPLVVRHRQLESKVHSLLDQLKREKGRLQDYCLLGLSNGAPELATAVSDLQRHYMDAITANPHKACETEYPQMMWEVRHKLLQQFYAVLTSNANSTSEKDAALFTQVKAVFTVEARQCADIMLAVLDLLLPIEQKTDPVLLSIHVIYLALGNVARYQFIYPIDGVSGMRERAISYYQQAITIYPGQGAAHRCLAAIAKSDHDAYLTCYHLCRALSCTNSLPSAREPLLEILESQRELADSFPSFTALSGLSLIQHCERFRCHFLAAAGIAYARTGADRFPPQLDKCRRHFAMMLQLLSIECSDGSDRGSKGSAVLYNPDIQQRQGSVDDSLIGLINKMEIDFRYALIIALSLLQQVVEKHNVVELLESTRYNDCYGGSDASTYSIEERVMLEKRYFTQRLHKIQTIPGFVDLARMVLSLMCAAFSAEGVGVGTSGSGSAASRYRTQCTVASVCLFFEWLVANPCYHVFPLLDVALWEQLEASLPIYLSQLPKLPKHLTNSWDANLMHDLDLCGFTPLQHIILSRANCEEDLSSSDALSLYAERCRRSIRTLCHTSLIIGEADKGICFDVNRQPSPVNINTATLQVLTYRALPASGGTLYTSNHKVLSREEFMQGIVAEEVEDSTDEGIEDVKDDIDEAAASLAAQCAAMLAPSSAEPASSSKLPAAISPPLPPSQKEEARGILRVAPPSNTNLKPTVQSQHRNMQPPKQLKKPQSTKSNTMDPPPLIVIDAPNVAMRHGLNSKFSCKGIKLAIDFFKSAGHKVVAFLPDYYLDYSRVGELRNATRLGITDERASKLPDNITILQQLVSEGLLIGTPPQDYDDSYCITYAKHRGGYVITNDMYRDHVKRIENKQQREELRQWLKTHCISYTFVGDEFLPNPDASLV